MIKEGIIFIKVIPLEGEKVFIKADGNEDCKTLLKDSEKFFQEEFNIVREWESKDIKGARFTWVKVYEVPVLAWRRKSFHYWPIPLVD